MAVLAIQNIVETGLTVSYVTPGASGDTFPNSNENVFLHVINASGGSINVTITAQNTTADNAEYGKLTKSNAVVAVGAGANKFIGPFRRKAFNNTSGAVAVACSAQADVTIAAIKLEH